MMASTDASPLHRQNESPARSECRAFASSGQCRRGAPAGIETTLGAARRRARRRRPVNACRTAVQFLQCRRPHPLSGSGNQPWSGGRNPAVRRISHRRTRPFGRKGARILGSAGFCEAAGLSENGVIPDRIRRVRPSRLAALVGVLDHGAQAHTPGLVVDVARIHTPGRFISTTTSARSPEPEQRRRSWLASALGCRRARRR